MSKLNGSTDCPDLLVNFDVSPESADHIAGFNPLLQFDHIGKKKLDQVCSTSQAIQHRLFQ